LDDPLIIVTIVGSDELSVIDSEECQGYRSSLIPLLGLFAVFAVVQGEDWTIKRACVTQTHLLKLD
jgi:hypothetical protein